MSDSWRPLSVNFGSWQRTRRWGAQGTVARLIHRQLELQNWKGFLEDLNVRLLNDVAPELRPKVKELYAKWQQKEHDDYWQARSVSIRRKTAKQHPLGSRFNVRGTWADTMEHPFWNTVGNTANASNLRDLAQRWENEHLGRPNKRKANGTALNALQRNRNAEKRTAFSQNQILKNIQRKLGEPVAPLVPGQFTAPKKTKKAPRPVAAAPSTWVPIKQRIKRQDRELAKQDRALVKKWLGNFISKQIGLRNWYDASNKLVDEEEDEKRDYAVYKVNHEGKPYLVFVPQPKS